ncbi:MAG: tyrosine--tRNA ligase [Vicinamibacterales bacterium]
MTIDEQLAYLTKGCVDVVRAQELQGKLERSAATGTPLVVKVGFDPTAPDLHLGHTVLIRKMKHFQDLGHTVVFLIGAFTGLIGDPTGRSKTRPPLTKEEIDANAETYKKQVFMLLDPAKTVVEFNSRWLGPLTSEGWVRLAAHYNVAQMLERRDFKHRYESGQPIAVHEFLYPLAQAYDSVFLKADVELGGTDQLFNLNVGRDVMPSYGLAPQVVMTVPLLVGLDGVEKMSKSYGNYVGITEPADEMFGKLMSISDALMWKYYELLTDLSVPAIEDKQRAVASGALHPKQAKRELAQGIVADFHSADTARAAADRFDQRFARKELPADLPVSTVRLTVGESRRLAAVIVEVGLAGSGSDATRKIQQGGVRVDGEKVADAMARVDASRASFTLEVGRRAVRVVVAAASA